MDWNYTLLAVHLGVFGLSLYVFSDAPGVIQKMIVALMSIGVALLSIGYAGPIFERDLSCFLTYGHIAENFGVLGYILRIFIIEQEKRCLPTSLQHSRRSLD